MSDAASASASQPEVEHGDDARDAHGDGHGHEPAAEPLGGIDAATWGYAIGGGAIGLVVAIVLFVARGG